VGRIVLGIVLLVGGAVLLGVGTAVSGGVTDVATLVALLLAPPVIALVGAVVLLSAIAPRGRRASPAATVARIIGVATVSGLTLGIALTIAGIAVLVPGWASGTGGPFRAGFGVGLAAVLEMGTGLVVGAIVGFVVALVWRSTRRG